MKKWTRGGIGILIIGISLLAGTIYRSNTTASFGNPRVDLAPNAWSPSESSGPEALKLSYFLLVPREYRIELISTDVINVYILDSEGIKQWENDQAFEHIWEIKETKQGTYRFQISKRDKYMMLLYNPTNENVTSEWHIMVYGIEQDLLQASFVIIATGLVIVMLSLIKSEKPTEINPTNFTFLCCSSHS